MMYRTRLPSGRTNWPRGFFFLAMVYRFLYIIRMKLIAFRGSSLDDLKAFPQDARREAGYPLDKVQNGFPRMMPNPCQVSVVAF